MSHRHTIRPRKVGQVRIYLAPNERVRPGGFFSKAMFGKALYMMLIQAAQRDGLPHAVAHHHAYGYSNSEKIHSDHPEYPNSKLTMCVELMGPTHDLELFIRKHGDLLQGKVIVHRDAEHWDIYAVDAAAELSETA